MAYEGEEVDLAAGEPLAEAGDVGLSMEDLEQAGVGDGADDGFELGTVEPVEDGAEEAPQAAGQPETLAALRERLQQADHASRGQLQALQQERHQRQLMEQRTNEMLAHMAQLQQQMAQRLGVVKSPEQEEAEQDPVELIRGEVAGVRNMILEREQQANYSAMEQALRHDAAQVMQARPDFQNAHAYLARDVMVQAMGAGANEQQAMQTWLQWEQQFVNAQVARGQSPSRALLAYAEMRGYQGAQNGTQQPQQGQPQSRLEQVAQRQAAAQGMPRGTRDAAAGGVPRTAKELADLDAGAFDELLGRMKDPDAYIASLVE